MTALTADDLAASPAAGRRCARPAGLAGPAGAVEPIEQPHANIQSHSQRRVMPGSTPRSPRAGRIRAQPTSAARSGAGCRRGGHRPRSLPVLPRVDRALRGPGYHRRAGRGLRGVLPPVDRHRGTRRRSDARPRLAGAVILRPPALISRPVPRADRRAARSRAGARHLARDHARPRVELGADPRAPRLRDDLPVPEILQLIELERGREEDDRNGCGRSWRPAGRRARSSPSPWTRSGPDANWYSRNAVLRPPGQRATTPQQAPEAPPR
jgi:hypothetical protein